MVSPTSATIRCAQCNAHYRVVRVEGSVAGDAKISRLGCGAPLNRDGAFFLKYFRVDAHGEHQSRAS